MTRIYTTPQGELETADVPMKDLTVGDLIVGDSVHFDGELVNPLYLVTGDCASQQRGWLFVRNLSIDPEAVHADGTLECEGFFNFPVDTLMHKVI